MPIGLSQLAEHVAKEMQDEAAIVKEACKAKEEAQNRRRPWRGQMGAVQASTDVAFGGANANPAATVFHHK